MGVECEFECIVVSSAYMHINVETRDLQNCTLCDEGYVGREGGRGVDVAVGVVKGMMYGWIKNRSLT